MLLGYNTNGFANHRLADALTILARIGYQSAAVTLERDHLDPPDPRGVKRCVETLRPLIQSTDLRVTIETGSRFILDPWQKHQPTLLSKSPDHRRIRVEFIQAAIDVAAAVSADCVSLWSGAPDDAGEPELFNRLIAGLQELLDYAAKRGVRLALEPEPGMLIDTMPRFETLHTALRHAHLGLTLDAGHVHCLADGNLSDHLKRWRDALWNVHLEDMRRGVHEHLMFGEGEMDFEEAFDALNEIRYSGPVHVELSRHSHDAVESAKRAYEFLRRRT